MHYRIIVHLLHQFCKNLQLIFLLIKAVWGNFLLRNPVRPIVPHCKSAACPYNIRMILSNLVCYFLQRFVWCQIIVRSQKHHILPWCFLKAQADSLAPSYIRISIDHVNPFIYSLIFLQNSNGFVLTAIIKNHQFPVLTCLMSCRIQCISQCHWRMIGTHQYTVQRYLFCVRKSILLRFLPISQRSKYFLRSGIFSFYLCIQFVAEPVFSESVLQFWEHPARKSPASCLPAQSIRNLCSPLLPVSPDLSDCLSVSL